MKFRAGYVSPCGGRAPFRATLASVRVNSCFHRDGANSNQIKEKSTLKINLCRAGGMLAVDISRNRIGGCRRGWT